MAAFLAMIAYSEGTAAAADPYRVCYKFSHTIQSLSEHPAISGEWLGVNLPDAECIAAGMAPPCISTAAGKYQINRPTWKRIRNALKLTDFSPDSQDTAAVELIREHSGLALVNSGQTVAAISQVKNVWASLPGNEAGQPQRVLAALLQTYTGAGGGFA